MTYLHVSKLDAATQQQHLGVNYLDFHNHYNVDITAPHYPNHTTIMHTSPILSPRNRSNPSQNPLQPPPLHNPYCIWSTAKPQPFAESKPQLASCIRLHQQLTELLQYSVKFTTISVSLTSYNSLACGLALGDGTCGLRPSWSMYEQKPSPWIPVMYTPLLPPPTLDDRQESCHARVSM